jgi:hypothetical protein
MDAGEKRALRSLWAQKGELPEKAGGRCMDMHMSLEEMESPASRASYSDVITIIPNASFSCEQVQDWVAQQASETLHIPKGELMKDRQESMKEGQEPELVIPNVITIIPNASFSCEQVLFGEGQQALETIHNPEREQMMDKQGSQSKGSMEGEQVPQQSDDLIPSGTASAEPPSVVVVIQAHAKGTEKPTQATVRTVQSQETPDTPASFEQATTRPLTPPLLQLPPSTRTYEVVKQIEQPKNKERSKLATRSSPRFKNNTKKRKPAIQLAQEMLAKKWGILDVEKEMEDLTLQQYINIYRKPLPQAAIMAVIKLTEVAEMKKKKKREMIKKKKVKASNKEGALGVAGKAT